MDAIEKERARKHAWYIAHRILKPRTHQTNPSKKSLKKFDTTKNLWCVITKHAYIRTRASDKKEFFNSALELLRKNGYECCCLKIQGKYYVVRKLRKDELKDAQFLQTYGETIEKIGEEYIFATKY